MKLDKEHGAAGHTVPTVKKHRKSNIQWTPGNGMRPSTFVVSIPISISSIKKLTHRHSQRFIYYLSDSTSCQVDNQN